MNDKAGRLDIHGILESLPHRFPFLLVDRVLECIPGERLVALKNVTVDEPLFVGHFPIRPVMPGVLVLEAMVQASGLLARETFLDTGRTLHYLAGVNKSRFGRPVEPGDCLTLTSRLVRVVRNMARFETEAEVAGEGVASAEILCVSMENDA